MTNGLLGAIAAHGLAGARPPPPGTPRPDEAWGPLLIDVGRHRLTGVLVAMVDAGLVDLSEAQRVELSERHESEMVACLELEAMMLTGIEVLTAAGVAPVVLKGPALAHLIAADPAQRSFGDIDLLVRADHVARALTALRAEGAERLVPELSPGYDRRFAKSITVGWDRFELDLHRTLAPGPYGLLIDQDSLHGATVDLVVGGRRLSTLDLDRHLVHACYHAVLGDVAPRLASQRDIVALHQRPDLNADAVRHLAAAWGGEAVLAGGLVSAGAALDVHDGPLHEWARSFVPSPSDRRMLATYRDQRRRFARQGRATLRVLPWRDRPAYLRALAWPTRANLDARGLSRRRHLSRR